MIRKMQDWIAKGKVILIGLEDSKKTWKIAVRSEGSVVQEITMPAQYPVLREYLKRFVDCKIKLIYEAGFKGFNLYDKLTADGIECFVLPPHLLEEAKGTKVKTDRHDARRLAKMLEDKDCPHCRVPDKELREDRQICRTLNAVEKEIKSTRNRIRKLLHYHGIESGQEDKQFWQKGEFRGLKNLELSIPMKKALDVLLEILESLWTHQLELRKELRSLSKKDRYKKAFTIVRSLPGIGWLTAVRLVLELGEDFGRFTSGRSIASFVGLTGSENSTGETIQKGRITGQGNNFVRSWLIESAWVAIKRDPVLQEFFQRIAKNSGSKKKAIVAVARKLIIRLRTCVITNVEYVLGVIE